MSEEMKKQLEDLPTEVEALTAEDAEQVSGGAISFVGSLDLANPKPQPASGALKTIAAAQTD